MIQAIKKIFGGKSEKRSSLENPEEWFRDALAGSPLMSGVTVSEQTAMRYSTIFACVRILSDTIASLPLILYRKRSDGGKERAYNHPLYPVLHDLPNKDITSFRLRAVLQGHLATWGNAYCVVVRDGNNRVRELLPIPPNVVSVSREKRGLVYKINGTETSWEILHIPGLGFDGVKGYSVIGMAREAIGLGLAAEEFGSRFFGEGTHPGAVVNHPGKLSDDAHRRLKTSLQKAHSGLGKSHRMMLLEEGMKLENIGIPPEDAQFIETRKFQRTEIYSIYRIPPHLIGDSEKSTSWGSGIEQQSIGFVVYTIRPWLVLWEQELGRVLLSDTDRKSGFFIEHRVDGLLRGDIKSRYDAYAVGRQNGWLSANDIRSMENMNPIENGDQYLVPLNMTSADPQGDADPQGGKEKDPEQKSFLPDVEFRKLLTSDEKSIHGLVSFEKKYHSRFLKVFKQIIDNETSDIETEIKRQFKIRSDETLMAWLESYYKKFPEQLKKALGPLLKEYAEIIEKESSRMVGGEPAFTKEMESFVEDYLSVYIKRHIGSSLGQLKGLMLGTEPEFLTDALLKRLDEWKEKRPEKTAGDEVIRQANAIAREAWRQKGITKLKWVTQGSNSCPFCRKLNGKIIGIKNAFLEKDDILTGQDANGNFMRIKGRKSHPPIHQGCVCAVVPVMETRYSFRKADPDTFVAQRDMLPKDLRPFVTPYSARDYKDKKIKLFLSESKFSGYGLTKDKELVSVFSHPGAHQGRIAVEKAVEGGAGHLYCFDTNLVKFYNQFGFKETGRMAWNDKYAPSGWNYKKFGKPELVSMARQEKKSDPDAYKKDPDWFKPEPGYKGNRGTKEFQKLADRYIETVFGKEELDKLKK